MNNNNKPREIWFTTGTNGRVSAWYFRTRQLRSFRIPMAQAELELATGAAVRVNKPEWV